MPTEMDGTCPPAPPFVACHACIGPKHVQLWKYNGHDAGGPEDLSVALSAFHSLLQEEF